MAAISFHRDDGAASWRPAAERMLNWHKFAKVRGSESRLGWAKNRASAETVESRLASERSAGQSRSSLLLQIGMGNERSVTEFQTQASERPLLFERLSI